MQCNIARVLFEMLNEHKFAEVIKLGFELQVERERLTRERVDQIRDDIKKQILRRH